MGDRQAISLVEAPNFVGAPATLNLLRVPRRDVPDALARLESVDNFATRTKVATDALRRVNFDFQERAKVVLAAQNNLSNADLRSLASSRRFGIAYLEISDELIKRGVSPQEAWSFFGLLVKELPKYMGIVQDDPTIEVGRSISSIIARVNSSDFLGSYGTRVAAHNFGEPPSWFGSGNKAMWRSYVVSKFSNLVGGLDLILDKNVRGLIAKVMDPRSIELGMARLEDAPDWFDGFDAGIPSRGDVELEVEQDSLAFENHRLQFLEMNKSRKRLGEMYYSQWLRTTKFLLAQREPYLTEDQSFFGLLLRMKLISALPLPPSFNIGSYSGASEKIIDEAMSDQFFRESQEEGAQKFANTLNPEVFALYLERKFGEAKIMAKETMEVGSEGLVGLDAFFGSLVGELNVKYPIHEDIIL